MSTGLVCPQCHADVEPTWDWCHACGYDPEGLKPQSIAVPVGVGAGAGANGNGDGSAAPAARPAPPRGAPTVGLSDGAHPYAGLPYDDSPPEVIEAPTGARRLVRRDKHAAKAAPAAAPAAAAAAPGAADLLPPPPAPAARAPRDVAPVPSPPVAAAGAAPVLERQSTLEALKTATPGQPIIRAPEPEGPAVVPASIISSVPTSRELAIDDEVPISRGGPDLTKIVPSKPERTPGRLIAMTGAVIAIILLLVYGANTLSETADTSSRAKPVTSGPPPLGAPSTASGATSAGAITTWVTFRTPDGRVTLQLPAEPSESTGTLANPAVSSNRFLAFSPVGLFGVDVFENPDVAQPLDATAALLQQPGDTVVSNEATTVAGHPAQRTVVRTADGGSRAATVISNGSSVVAVYLLRNAQQGEATLDGPEYQHVIESLQLA